MQDVIEFSGNRYSSVRTAADAVGLSRDYIARLCRTSMVQAKRVGSAWYVDLHSLRALIRAQEFAREYRRSTLSQERVSEYRAKQGIAATLPAAVAPQSVRERMQRAIDGSTAQGIHAARDSMQTPGLLHAAVHIPAQALIHVPTYAISPTMELVHRLAALIGAFVVVFGGYSLIDHTYAVVAYESTLSGLQRAAGLSERIAAAAAAGDAATTNGLEQFAAEPARSIAGLRVALNDRAQSLAATAAAAISALPHTAQATAPVSAAAAAAAAAPSTRQSDAPAAAPSLGSPIAIAINFTGDHVAYGDLVAYDAKNGVYTLTHGSDDPTAFGVVIQDPALLFKPQGTDSNISVVRSGSALVNVTLEGGPIAVGDPLTSSSIPGKARKALSGEHHVGIAAEAFTGAESVALTLPDGSTVQSGTISMSVGLSPDSSSAQSEGACTSASCKFAAALDPQVVRALIRYVLSGLIAAISLTFAFRSFMSDANYGVISMGRNPRAKSSIQSLVFFNAVLALAIASAGLFAAIMVLFSG